MMLNVFEALISADKAALLLLNSHHSAAADSFFAFITERFVWIPAYLALVVYLFRTKRSYFWQIIFTALLLILITDQLSSSVIKPWVQRLRPCHDPSVLPFLHLVDGKCGGTFGFVSSHAANTFALASYLFSLYHHRWNWLSVMVFSWAILVSISRIYLGVHFPADVLFGALLGIVFGSFAAYCLKRFVFRTTLG